VTKEFYTQHLERLMDYGIEESVVPQLYAWMTRPDTANTAVRPNMSLEDFTACVDLLLTRVEKVSMQEESNYHSDAPSYPDSVFQSSFGALGES
jgi:hypothetical protein